MMNCSLYACYSVNLMKFLSLKGIRYELCGRHPNKEVTMWVYVRSPKLNDALNEYQESSVY